SMMGRYSHDYYGGSATSRLHRSSADLPITGPDGRSMGRARDPSHGHRAPVDGSVAQLCPCDIATSTPHTFLFASLPAPPPIRLARRLVAHEVPDQALDRSAPMLPMMPGVPGRSTHDYVRYGTTSLFAALDVATGKIIGQTHRRHRQQEFLRFLKTIDKVPPA